MSRKAAPVKPDNMGIFATDRETDTTVWSLVKSGMPLVDIARSTGITIVEIKRIVARKQNK